MTYLISILIFTAVFFLVIALTSGESERPRLKLQSLLDEEDITAKKSKPKGILAVLMAPNRVILNRLNLTASIIDSLRAARINLYPEEFLALKEVSAVGLGFLAALMVGAGEIVLIVALGVIGFFAPDIYIKIKIKNIKEEINKTLPDVVDLLALCVGAGLSFTLALKWVTEKSQDNYLINELKNTLKEINVGKPRREALSGMAKRLDSPDVARFVRTIIQAEKMGTSVSEALAILSEDSRNQRFRQGERMALKAPIKMLFPLIFCIMPVVLILIAAPIFLRFTQGGFGF